LKLDQAVVEAYNRQWSMVNTFTVQIDLSPELTDLVGGFRDDLNLSIISITTPDFVNDPIESFIANRWFIQNGRDALYRYNITFRDYDQMNLYKKFMKIYNFTKTNYFNKASMNIHITKDGDWFNELDKKFLELDGTLVEAVSNISFSNDTENQIAEFTVSLKCNKPSLI